MLCYRPPEALLGCAAAFRPLTSQIIMRINANVTIAGEVVILVPYRKDHVSTYHTWMVRLQLYLPPRSCSSMACRGRVSQTSSTLRVSNTRLEHCVYFAARPKTSGSHSFRAPYIAGKCIGTRDLLLTVSCHFTYCLLCRKSLTCS